jgi:hypothetical protein
VAAGTHPSLLVPPAVLGLQCWGAALSAAAVCFAALHPSIATGASTSMDCTRLPVWCEGMNRALATLIPSPTCEEDALAAAAGGASSTRSCPAAGGARSHDEVSWAEGRLRAAATGAGGREFRQPAGDTHSKRCTDGASASAQLCPALRMASARDMLAMQLLRRPRNEGCDMAVAAGAGRPPADLLQCRANSSAVGDACAHGGTDSDASDVTGSLAGSVHGAGPLLGMLGGCVMPVLCEIVGAAWGAPEGAPAGKGPHPSRQTTSPPTPSKEGAQARVSTAAAGRWRPRRPEVFERPSVPRLLLQVSE